MIREENLRKVVLVSCIISIIAFLCFILFILYAQDFSKKILDALALLNDQDMNRSEIYFFLLFACIPPLILLALLCLSLWQLLKKQQFGYYKVLMWLSVPQVYINDVFGYALYLGPQLSVGVSIESVETFLVSFPMKFWLFYVGYYLAIQDDVGPYLSVGINFVPLLMLSLIKRAQLPAK